MSIHFCGWQPHMFLMICCFYKPLNIRKNLHGGQSPDSRRALARNAPCFAKALVAGFGSVDLILWMGRCVKREIRDPVVFPPTMDGWNMLKPYRNHGMFFLFTIYQLASTGDNRISQRPIHSGLLLILLLLSSLLLLPMLLANIASSQALCQTRRLCQRKCQNLTLW